MKVLFCNFEDFSNYKLPSMFVGIGCTCTWKCGGDYCQNSHLAHTEPMEICPIALMEKYMRNEVSESIVLGGLEPLDSPDLIPFLEEIRTFTKDPIIIYTGYIENEVTIDFSKYGNIVVKYGRYIPNDTPRFDEILGVELASRNQYAVRYE